MTKVSIHRFDRLPGRFLTALALGLGILAVGAIAPPPSSTQEPVTPPSRRARSAIQRLPALTDPQALWEGIAAQPQPELLTVTLYAPAATCDGYQETQRAIAAEKAVPQIVHFLLAEQTPNLLNFSLSGYRVQTTPGGNSVTIDFRVTPGSERHLISLSMCEQQALFGSLRRTLLENPILGIQTVRFTEGGRPVAL